MSKVFDEIIVAIDIGTTKICVLIAKRNGQDIKILGIGKAPSHGLKKGVVVDIEKTVLSIREAVKEAEFVSKQKVEFAVVGISGSHIQSFNSSGVVPIKGGVVSQTDIANVIDSAKATKVPEGQQILHVLPQYYQIDGQELIHNPKGMHGIRLESKVHIITGSVASVQNIVHCCQLAGVKVSDIVLEQLASADAVLSEDEIKLGVAVLDIGGGTSDLALYQNGSIRYTKVFPVAGNHFTNDLAIGLKTTISGAEKTKQEFGLAFLDLLKHDEELVIDSIHSSEQQKVRRSEIVQILQPRAYELLSIVKQEIDKNNLKNYMTTGLVLTGGGSLLEGMKELAKDIFDVPVRIGMPKTGNLLPESLDNPIFATGFGLLVHKIKKHGERIQEIEGPIAIKIFFRMKSWISDFF